MKNESANEVKAGAHKLKSSSLSVGAKEMAEVCLALEDAGKENDMEKISELTPKLEPLFRLVQEYVQTL